MERFRECFYRPLLSSTANYERWLKLGGKDATARATDICAKTLDGYEQPPLDDANPRRARGVREPAPRRARRLKPGRRDRRPWLIRTCGSGNRVVADASAESEPKPAPMLVAVKPAGTCTGTGRWLS